MATKTVIPRFLLPLQGPLWRGIRIPPSQNVRIRFASSSDQPPRPIVLEKPARFNPPSHGSRLKRNAVPKHYGPELTAAEVAAQNKREYPGLMSPEGTWSHWFWNSRLLHTFITMGALFAMAIYTFFMNYAYNSPFKELVPPVSDLWHHPSYFFAAWKNVIALHEKDKATKAAEHRTRHLDDVAKRRYFMKAHGIETKDPISMVFGKDEEKSEQELEAAALGKELATNAETDETPAPKKKWLGLF
ncbi:uncharacterized protein UV8b_01359 [Ustilaginoidea virens]|uniref:Uncharacterized protein n=1 Tax=Ustilaginoidea virens TaxID=1159556 RepID=A0A063BZL1_USTVR|nr:uncharacterized protein UV8b_01359 [Ustilaginoidea virens]QUC17118.1 hypothetical protein UV8b_01359 [Ustilaginoidea virens]GAO17710.1 hypothetical protein UVI_02058200 [Ustilaginoidea virens]